MRREHLTIQYGPCPNCEKGQAYMGSSEWGHSHLCCSNACGIRLGKRIENKMINLAPSPFVASSWSPCNEARLWKRHGYKGLY